MTMEGVGMTMEGVGMTTEGVGTTRKVETNKILRRASSE